MAKWVCTVCGYVYEGDQSTGRVSGMPRWRRQIQEG